MADDWKKHAPYALEDGNKEEDYNVRRGECYCKSVTWGFNSPKPLDAKFCQYKISLFPFTFSNPRTLPPSPSPSMISKEENK